MKRPRHQLLAPFLAGAMTACHAGPLTRGQCERVLNEQAEQWNRGDLRAFVATYWPGPELTFLGSGGLTRGQQDLLANYERGYPTAAARGVLTFHVLDFQPLGDDHALLLGRYELDRAKPDAGFFSLVLRRHGDTVAILHDHTSRAASAEAAAANGDRSDG
ncbi:MAG: DUF4440 domain-containing protein [Planctomycetes bacterium]|nr:DUF4440 domain-containing protein [Planctomycetota bacterium]